MPNQKPAGILDGITLFRPERFGHISAAQIFNSSTHATVTVDSTNIKLSWTAANSLAGTFHFIWEVT